jgi:DNA-binding XRE family transcriptional regulator
LRERPAPPAPSPQISILSKEIPGATETHRECVEQLLPLDHGSATGMESKHDSSVGKNRVRELRENRLMTQAQLARKAKVALRTIHSVEKGMNCRMDTKRKILLALGMRFEDKDYVFPPVRNGGNGGAVSSDDGRPATH